MLKKFVFMIFFVYIIINKSIKHMVYAKNSYDDLVNNEKELKKKYSEIEEECLLQGLSFDEFCKKAESVKKDLFFIDKYKRYKKDPVITYGKEWNGTVMTIENFKTNCEKGTFTDENGTGYYATENSKSDINILPSDFEYKLVRKDFTHVIWFNN